MNRWTRSTDGRRPVEIYDGSGAIICEVIGHTDIDPEKLADNIIALCSPDMIHGKPFEPYKPDA